MADSSLLTFIVEQGGLAAVATLALLLLNAVWKDRLKTEAERTDRERDDKLTVTRALVDSATTNAELKAALDHLTAVLTLCLQDLIPPRTAEQLRLNGNTEEADKEAGRGLRDR